MHGIVRDFARTEPVWFGKKVKSTEWWVMRKSQCFQETLKFIVPIFIKTEVYFLHIIHNTYYYITNRYFTTFTK